MLTGAPARYMKEVMRAWLTNVVDLKESLLLVYSEGKSRSLEKIGHPEF